MKLVHVTPVVLMLLSGLRVASAGMFEERFQQWDSNRWKIEGRGENAIRDGVLQLTGCEAVAGDENWTDYELSFRARAPRDAAEAQIWASVRRTARDSRYVIGLRGGNSSEIYIARYAPNGRQAFLGFHLLDRPPMPGAWRQVRIAIAGRKIQVYLDQDPTAAMEVSDDKEGWLPHGGISLGGGYLATEYADVVVRPLDARQAAEFGANAVKINFQPESMPPVPGWKKATGAAMVEDRGSGWLKAMATGERKRDRLADPVRDTVLSVAGAFQENEFRYKLPDGDYLVTLWAGDPAYAIAGRFVFQDDTLGSEPISLTAGQFASIAGAVSVRDGLLRLKIQRTGGPGVSVQALVIERRDQLAPGRWEQVLAPIVQRQDRPRELEQKRQQQRAAYRPVAVEKLVAARHEISLDGKWLFLPDYEFKPGVDYADPGTSDDAWHVMDVPAFWTTADNWLYEARQGGSDRWCQLERARLGQYTFDWQRTKAAWYRHTFELRELSLGRRFELHFDAIAKVSEIYVNGHRVAGNVGMFRPTEIDVTPWVRKGRNQIAVRAVAVDAQENTAAAEKVAAVAVTVAVTDRMLKSLPQAIYGGRPGGIWQPVKLVVHQEVQVQDVFFQPRLDGAKIELTLENKSDKACEVVPQIDFTSRQTGEVLTPKTAFSAVPLGPGQVATVTLDTGAMTPELWTPAKPNLYVMRAGLQSADALVDQRQFEVGFRTVDVLNDGRIYLNGKPYWLRGGCHTPMPTCPNDRALADKFTRLMHDGNVRVTRTVCAPWNELWLGCADRNGVGVSQEGVWPWLMLDGKVIPEAHILDAWRSEHLALIKKYRNHPSILFWTVNNESYYVRQNDPKRLEQIVTILSGTIKAMRAIDPTRPICPDSGGVQSRFPPFYEKLAKEKGFDYGDIDDKHCYTSWYVKSFFQHYPGQETDRGEQLSRWATPGRPMISQEMSTGYPNADDGHAVRKYIFDHMVPQAWVGDYAYEHQDPRYFLGSVEFNTKELAETLRCNYRGPMAGVMHFALNTWFQNLFEADRIRPYPPATALASALQPVLVSARLYGRHFYAGDKQQVNLFLVNDDEDGRDLGPTRLAWSLDYLGQTLAQGEHALPPVPYYHNHETAFSLELPGRLPLPRVDAELVLQLFDGDRLVSKNGYDVTLAEKSWVKAPADIRPAVLDAGHASRSLWARLELTPRWIADIPGTADRQPLVICEYAWVQDGTQRERFLNFVATGGRVLLVEPGSHLKTLFPDLVHAFRAADGEIVTMRVPESPVFDGIGVMDLRWFERGGGRIPLAAHGDFSLAEAPQVEILAKHTPVHGYLTTQQQRAAIEGAVIFTLRHGRGRVWVSQLAHETAVRDPIAGRVMRNLLAVTRDLSH